MEMYLSPKLDVVAKMMFEQNTDLLMELLTAVLKIPGGIKQLTILNPYSKIDGAKEKKSIMDIKVELQSGGSAHVEFQVLRADLELQVRKHPDIFPRLSYYKSRMLTEQLLSGDSYTKLVPITCVALLDFTVFGDEFCHHKFEMYEAEHNMEYPHHESIHIVEIPKYEHDTSNEELVYWLKFFSATTKEEFEVLSKQNDTMEKAVTVLADISSDEATRMIAEAREKELRDQISRERGAREEGKIEGRIEGIKEGEIGVAKNLLKLGFPIDIVIKSTGLNEAELRGLLN